MSSAKADLTLQDAVKNTALHLACTKVSAARRPPAMTRREMAPNVFMMADKVYSHGVNRNAVDTVHKLALTGQ